MKSLIVLAGLFIMSTGAFAQNFLYLENGTSCDLIVQLYASDPSSGCSYAGYANYVVPSGASIPAVAPGSTEWVYAEVVSWPNTSCFGQALDTDGFPSCVSCPGYGAPNGAAVTVNTSICSTCPPVINMLWTAYCGSGPGHIHFYP